MAHHGHTHHAHGGSPDAAIKGRLAVAIVFTAVIFVAELVGGYFTNSLALMSDAVHVFMDVLALSLSLFAIRISEMKPTETRTYGLHRVEVFASFINSFVLFIATAFIFYKAYGRLAHPQQIHSEGMLYIAVIGLVVNVVVALRLMRYAATDLNIKSAYLHVVGDAAASVAVIAGAVIIRFTGWTAADPLLSFLIGGIILYGAVNIMRESSHILLEGVPREIDLNAVKDDLLGFKGVEGVHSLHIWSICHNVFAMSAHLDIESDRKGNMGEVFSEINERLARGYHIFYTTLQAECSGCNPNDTFGSIAHKERKHKH